MLIIVSLAALLPAGSGVVVPRRPQEQGGNKMCPVVTVSCPELLSSGVPSVFTANVSGGDDKVTPTYEWEVSAGTITEGRGESYITVDTTGLGYEERQPLTATVKVGGFPPECRVRASCTTEMYVIRDYFPVDEYGNLSYADEKARLDNYAITLQSGAEFDGYIICYGGRRGRRGEAWSRCARAKNYLVTRHKIPAERVVTVDGGYREELTVMLWPLPHGVQFTPDPTVDPSEVEFISEPKRPKSRKPRAGSRRKL
jgi:hypothetical protein